MARITSIVPLVLAISAMVCLPACTQTSTPHAAAVKKSGAMQAERQERVPGEYLVTLASSDDEVAISERYGRFGIKDINALGNDTFLLVLSNDPGPQEMRALIRHEARIRKVQPNLVFWANRSGRKTKQ